jgi:hypothetical protein
MKVVLGKRSLLAAAISLSVLSFGRGAYAAVTLQVQRLSLANVDDAAGRWQHEGGRVLLGSQQVGNYIIVRRVTPSGTGPQNTASVTMTIFLLGSSPPRNLTLQGAHDFGSGRYVGSVSAASDVFMGVHQGSTFAGDAGAGTLTFSP